MRVTTLIDNRPAPQLTAEWGLAFWIEYQDKHILLDTGGGENFARNAAALGIYLSRADFAVILNEYALVVGVITINDVMSTVMGELVVNADELQIVEREDGTWLVDGSTPIDDLEHALDIDEFPEDTTYETVAGFMMYMLRKIPKRTDKVVWAGYTFEVIDVDNNKIDQILVTRNKRPAPVADAEEPAKAD